MQEHVYSGSVFWLFIAIAADLVRFSLPFVFVFGCAVWVWRDRSSWAYTAAFGATLSVIGYFTRSAVPTVHSISLGKELQPLVEQNPVIFFLFIYGLDIGYFLIAIGLLGHFLRRRHHA